MLIEAVTVCVGYDDFLCAAAPWNRPLFDRWIVVTSPEDIKTREVCRRFHLDCILSDDHKRDGTFAKGRLIARGVQHCRAGAWRLHLDADIVLPATMRPSLESAHLDPECIYGCDRVMVRSWTEWQRLLASGYLLQQHNYRSCVRWPEGFAVGTRWVSPENGYVPIGFFQLWSGEQDEWRGTWCKPYPRNHGTSCRTDVQHGLQWDRRKRALLPEIIAVHLESEPASLGANWDGRTTKRFGPADATAGGMKGVAAPS